MNAVEPSAAEPGGLLDWVNWGSAPDWLVAAIAALAAWLAIKQLRKVADANDAQVSVARAELMLEIDGRFESDELAESRKAIRTLRNHCDAKARKELRAGANDEEVFAKSIALFSGELSGLRERLKTADPVDATKKLTDQPKDSAADRYFTYMRLPYWAETVASLTRDGLLLEDDVLNLYDAVFINTIACFEQHIRDRQAEGPRRNQGFLEHALWLKNRAVDREDVRARDAERQREVGRDARRGIFGRASRRR